MAFNGTWQVYAQENYEAFLKALGKCLATSEIICSDCNTLHDIFYYCISIFKFCLGKTTPCQESLLSLIWKRKEAENCTNQCRNVTDNPQIGILTLDESLRKEEVYQKSTCFD